MERSQGPFCPFTISLCMAHFSEWPGEQVCLGHRACPCSPSHREGSYSCVFVIGNTSHSFHVSQMSVSPGKAPDSRTVCYPGKPVLEEVFIVEEKFRHSGLCFGGFSVEMDGPSVCPCPSMNLCSVQQTESHTLRHSVSQLWRLCLWCSVCVCVICVMCGMGYG